MSKPVPIRADLADFVNEWNEATRQVLRALEPDRPELVAAARCQLAKMATVANEALKALQQAQMDVVRLAVSDGLKYKEQQVADLITAALGPQQPKP